MSDKMDLKLAVGWAVRPIDADHTAVMFDVGEEEVGAVLPNDALGQFTGRIIKEAVKAGQSQTPRFPDGEPIVVSPVPVSGMAVNPGRAATEALMTVRFGNLTLTFSVDTSILQPICTDLLDQLRPADRPPGTH